MAGFTPINARTVSAPVPNANETLHQDEVVAGQREMAKRRQPARKKAATPDDTSQAAAGDVDPKSTNKRISGKGRKRTTQLNDEIEPKRHKSGSLKLSMHTTKTGVGSTTTADPEIEPIDKEPNTSSTDGGVISLAFKAKLDGFRYSTRLASRTETTGGPAPSTPVYVPQTSMSAFQQAQPQTTMQAIKSSAGGSSLLYSSSSTVPGNVSRAGYAQPLLNPTPPHVQGGTRHTAPARNQAQLPTPANSDPIPRAGAQSSSTVTRSLLRTDSEDFGGILDNYDDNNGYGSHHSMELTSKTPRSAKSKSLRTDSDDFGDPIDDEDDDVIELTKQIEQSVRAGKSPPARARKLNIREAQEYDDYGGALLSEEERRLLDAIRIPQDTRRPIVRTAFPPPILDRTSLFGVTNTNALRTCFRVGEALNTGCQAVRINRNLVLELYARITSSWREPKPSRKQHFIINDLYHDKPPFISGTFELWDQSSLWEQDSRPFLEADAEGMICRMIARMKRDGTKWRLEILNIWQADWDDVEHVADIYAKPPADEDS